MHSSIVLFIVCSENLQFCQFFLSIQFLVFWQLNPWKQSGLFWEGSCPPPCRRATQPVSKRTVQKKKECLVALCRVLLDSQLGHGKNIDQNLKCAQNRVRRPYKCQKTAKVKKHLFAQSGKKWTKENPPPPQIQKRKVAKNCPSHPEISVREGEGVQTNRWTLQATLWEQSATKKENSLMMTKSWHWCRNFQVKEVKNLVGEKEEGS